MKISYRHAFLSITALALGLLQSGCVNLEPVSDSTSFHIIGGGERQSVDVIRTRVAIRDANLLDFLDNSQLVELTGDNEVRYLSQHRWAGALDSMIIQVVASELENSVSGLYATSGDSPEADLNIDLTVLQFSRTAEGAAIVTLEYRIIDAESKALVAEDRFLRKAQRGIA